MVKFADGPPFQDAYLSSLRKNDGLFDSPSPKLAARKPRATSKPASGAPAASAAPTAAKHASPILQRAAARREERLAFLHSCGPGGKQLERELHDKEQKEKELGHPTEHPSQRTQRLWDLDAPVEVPEQRDDFSDITHSDAGAVWDAARVRREMRKDMAKQAQSDLEEIEQLAAGMRKRAQRYSPMTTKEDEMRAEDAEIRDEDCAEGSYKDEDVGPKVNGGAVLVRAMDDGYGGMVAGRAGPQKHAHDGSVESFIHKFQTARIRHRPSTREDELMAGESDTPSKREQARKAIPYRGINEEDGEEYLATSNANGYDRSACAANSPTNARLQRIREMRSRPQARDDAPEPSDSKSEEKERARPKKAANRSTSWYEERKRQQQDGISSGSDRLESWWRVQRGNQEGVRDGGTKSKPFEELVDEPTVDDATPTLAQKKKGVAEENEPVVMSRPPLSPVPNARTGRKGERGDDAPASPSLAAFRARLAQYDAGHGGDRAGPSPAARNAGRPCPETPVRSVEVPARRPRHDTPQSAGASVLSDADEGSRCHSVAQSTLAVLLARLEEARANFAKALEEGDVARQAELAGLMSRLGEAAVTMRKLEQV